MSVNKKTNYYSVNFPEINLMLWKLHLDFKMYRETTKSEHKKFEEKE